MEWKIMASTPLKKTLVRYQERKAGYLTKATVVDGELRDAFEITIPGRIRKHVR